MSQANSGQDITIKMHHPSLAPWFKSLNKEWLIRFFEVEPIDEYVLSNPDKIIAEGGQIIYALMADDVVGCVALKHHGDGVFELTKMAVTEACQAKGIGAVLMEHCIREFQSMNSTLLYLETHSSLAPAIKLYERFGFVRKPCPFESEYQRSDFYMRYLPNQS